MPKDTVEEKMEEFRKFFDWADSANGKEVLRWQVMYGCTPELLLNEIEQALTTAYNKGVEVGRMEERNKLWIEFEEERKRHDVFVDAIACKSLEDFTKWKEDRKATLTDKQVSL